MKRIMISIVLISLVVVNGFSDSFGVNSGIDIQNSAPMTLIEATKQQKVQKVKELLEAGADVNQTDASGATALHWAANKGYEGIAKMLINNGADLEAKDGNFQGTPLLWAAYDGSLAVVKVLVDSGCDVDSQNSLGNTALHNAALMGRPYIAEVLINNGADTTLVNNNGKTALDIATEMNRTYIIDLLTGN